MAWQHNLGLQLRDTDHGRIEIVNLKPKEHAVAIGSVSRITDRSMVVCHLEVVQLQNQLPLWTSRSYSLPPWAL